MFMCGSFYHAMYHKKLSGGWLLCEYGIQIQLQVHRWYYILDIEWDHSNPSVDKGTKTDVALTLKSEAKKSSVK